MFILVGRPDFSFVYANVVLYSVAQVAAELVAARQKIHSMEKIRPYQLSSVNIKCEDKTDSRTWSGYRCCVAVVMTTRRHHVVTSRQDDGCHLAHSHPVTRLLIIDVHCDKVTLMTLAHAKVLLEQATGSCCPIPFRQLTSVHLRIALLWLVS